MRLSMEPFTESSAFSSFCNCRAPRRRHTPLTFSFQGEKTELVGMPTRPAALAHPWGATSCNRAAPLTIAQPCAFTARGKPAPPVEAGSRRV